MIFSSHFKKMSIYKKEKSSEESVVICVVGNFGYLRKHLNKFIENLREKGKFSGEVLVLTSYFTPLFLLNIKNKQSLNFKKFRKIKFDSETDNILKKLNSKGQPNRHIHKNFQWHKLHLFDKELKNWNYVFYMDINLIIHDDINQIIELKEIGTLLAREDGYPNFDWLLSEQFDTTNFRFRELSKKYDLEIKNYFQTGLMFFDTKIITNSTKSEILELIKKFPITLTNEQAIFNLYFIYHRNVYKPLPAHVGGKTTYYYWKENDNTIITKQIVPKYK